MLRRLYDWILAKAADPRAVWWLIFFAFADGGLFPFPPHPLLALMCLAEPKKAIRYGIITSLASLAGGTVGYLIGHFVYQTVGTEMLSALHLTSRFPKAACYLNHYGVEIIVFKAATPIPFMLLTMTAGFISFPYPLFAAASLASRGFIFVGTGVLFRTFGPPIKAFIDRYLGLVVGGAAAVLLAGYVAIVMLGGDAAHTQALCANATSLPAR